MKLEILFITRIYPYPAQTGDLRYTSGLIESLAALPMVNLTVFCGSGRPASQPKGSILWVGPKKRPDFMSDIASLLSRYPRGAARACDARAIRDLRRLLADKKFDAALLNEAVCAKAVPAISRSNTPILYVSHNVEADIRPKIAAAVQAPLKRSLQCLDAKKYRKMELDLLKTVAGLTAITEQDSARYAQLAPDLRSIVIKPGYSKDREILPFPVQPRPAKAVLIGSFEWGAKRLNLEKILSAYAKFSNLERGGFPLCIAGKMPKRLLGQLRQKYPEVEFISNFDRLAKIAEAANIALVLEDLGGGFKLKTLDYIFSGLAIVGLPAAMSGSGLTADEDYIAVPSIEAAMPEIARLMQDPLRVKQLAASAHSKAEGKFDWSERANRLLEFIEQLRIPDQGKQTVAVLPGNPTHAGTKVDIYGV